MPRKFLVLLLLLSLPLVSSAEPAAHEDLLGLWRVLQVKNLDTGEIEPERREYHVYTESHEMIVLAGVDRPKLKKSLSEMTPEEMATQQPIGAGFYSYTIEGDTIVRTAELTLSAFYEGRTVRTEFELDGDRLVIRDRHSADGQLRQWTMERVE